MSSLLILTADPTSADAIQRVARDSSFRARTVTDMATAHEWLAMQNFDAFLIDSRYGDRAITEVLETCWKQNPMCVGAVFNLYRPIPAGLTAQLLGARIFFGPSAIPAIRQLLQSVPQRDPFLSGGRLGVLLVEDLDAPRDIIRSYIEALGNTRVEAVGSADEALAILREHPEEYYCVVTDFSMPQRSGLDLVAEIRDDPELRDIPVVVLTAYATGEALIECIKAGATGFLVKPPKKKALRFELEKAKRLFVSHQSPRLCAPEEAHLLEEAIQRRAA